MKDRRTQYRIQTKKLAREAASATNYTRQVQYDDPYDGLYDSYGDRILRPPYSPTRLYEVYEESGVIQACVETIIQNVDGYGHRIVPNSGSELDLSEEERNEKERIEAFFETPNGVESFYEIREKLRRDIEVTGNGYLEVVRNTLGKPHLLFWLDAKKTRLLPLDEERVPVEVKLLRDGKIVRETVYRQFRSFVYINEATEKTLVYFKEYGDPRILDAETGEFYDPGKEPKDFIPASEVIHFKEGNGTYGIPRWIGTLLNALGLSRAEFVNFDLFDSQAVPPLIITVAGGELTDESFEDLLALLKKSKGVQNFHKVLVLEAESSAVTPDGRSAVPKIEVQDLMAFRREDSLFSKYLNEGRTAVRTLGFRLPGIFIGDHTGVNFATAKISRELAEEQLFIPLRLKFDDKINATLMRDLNATNLRFKTDGPVIKSSQDVVTIFPQLLKSSVFSMNELVQFTNENFGLNLKPYEDSWADLPIGLLLYWFQALGMKAGGEGLPPEDIPNILGSTKPILQTTDLDPLMDTQVSRQGEDERVA